MQQESCWKTSKTLSGYQWTSQSGKPKGKESDKYKEQGWCAWNECPKLNTSGESS